MVENISKADMMRNIEGIRARIAAAAERSGRSAGDVTLVGVSKFQPIESIRLAAECGIEIVGENRVQERAEKQEKWPGSPLSWHMIGHLQRNKARRAVELFDCIQSVDNAELASIIQKAAAEKNMGSYPIMIEINTSGEDSKNGASPDECDFLTGNILESCPNLSIEGLMTIGPLTDDEAAIRRSFALLRSLRDAARQRFGIPIPHLSMGMSGDYEAAIEEGSTVVRIGTGIFGPRHI